MYRKAGVELAAPAIVAGTFSLIAAGLAVARGFCGVKFAVGKDSEEKENAGGENAQKADDIKEAE